MYKFYLNKKFKIKIIPVQKETCDIKHKNIKISNWERLGKERQEELGKKIINTRIKLVYQNSTILCCIVSTRGELNLLL